jgi:hypothetical protein
MARIAEETLAEIRARLPIEAVVGRQVQLRRSGARFSGLCPFHGERTPSFEVRPDRRTFHCYGCGAHGDIFAFVMQSERCDFPQAVARCAAEAGVDVDAAPGERRALAPPPPPAPAPDNTARIAKARRKWQASRVILPGSPQAQYLHGRRLWPLPEAAHRVLRAVDLEHMDTGAALHAAMIARVDDAEGMLTAVHCTFLEERPDAVGKLRGVNRAKLVFGALPGGAAIRLAEPAARMGVAEGIETALAAGALHGLPVWAAISAGGMERFQPPPICAELQVFADRDKPRLIPTPHGWAPEGQGMRSARELAQRQVGRCQVRIRMPLPPAGDYADVLVGVEA